MMAVDADATELATAELGRLLNEGEGGALGPYFPFLLLVVCDGSHAVTRFLSRPWQADNYMRETVSMFAKGKDSPAQLIHFSKDLRSWYREAQERVHRATLWEYQEIDSELERSEAPVRFISTPDGPKHPADYPAVGI